ncbi:MAG: AAA family ATPase [Methanobacteriaceae archaeon]
MSPAKKVESALGKGLDALIRKRPLEEEITDEKARVKTTTQKRRRRGSKESKNEQKAKSDSNSDIVGVVVLEVRRNPRISLWSAKSAAVLRFLKNTKPAFSISKEASALIEEAVKQKYPEIWELFQDEDF